MHSVKDFTRHKLEHMKASGSPPANRDRDDAAEGDDYGMAAARGSSSAQFKAGGHVEHGKKPHMGRAHRARGGGILGNKHDVTKPTAEPIRQGNYVKLASGGAARGEGARDAEGEEQTARMNKAEKEQYANEKRGGRIHRASGGRAKGKTVVNVIIAGNRGQPQGAPPPMAAPPPPPPMAAPPPPPPHPMPMMPSGGAPMGPMGAPPGGMPMRAHGGKVDGFKNFGRGGVKGGPSVREGGGGGARGRLQKAAAEGAHYPRGER